MKRYLKYIIISLVAIVAVACDPLGNEMPQFKVKDKTVLVYMAGNNNLSGNALENLEDLKKGYVPTEDNLLVYYHIPQQNPLLLRLFKDETGAVVQDTVYRFGERNSAKAESLKNAMQVTHTMFPAQEYGLFLWSHGTGWLPAGHYTKSFGEENGVEMEITELVKAIPYKLSYVIFDACLMGCVEVAYQMKDSVEYVISSPAEILASGFPYTKVMQHLFAANTDLEAVAMEYFSYYNQMNGMYRSATISLVKTAALKEVADAAKVVFDKYRDNIATLNYNSVQGYYRYDKHWFYDLGDFISNIAPYEDAKPVLDALDKAVLYKAATPDFLEISIDPSKYSGLGTYIPISPSDPELDAFYKKLDWNIATGLIKEDE